MGSASSAAAQPAATPPSAARPTAPGIVLAPMLVVELPAPGRAEIAPDVPPLKDVLESASSSSLRVTHDQIRPLPIGATEVTWTAWSGAPGASAAQFTRKAYVYVFPFGQTPVGWSRKHNSTAGNHASKVARDSEGAVHVAWLEDDKPGSGVFYRRGAQDPATGAVTWGTAPIRVSDDRSGGSFLALEASANAVHLAWYGRERIWYRRLVRAGGAWRFEPTRDTGAASGGAGDNGPDIGVRGDDEIHLLGYGGQYALSTNGGARWRVEQVPWPGGEKKNPAIAVDALGNAHVVFILKARTPERGFSGGRPSGGYWQLRYVRRQAQGDWTDAHDALVGAPQWADRGERWDTLADWPDIAADRRGDIHVVFHGTANTGIYGRDEPFYVRRPSRGPGAWAGWEQPQALHPVNRAARHSYGFAPSLSLDSDGDTVVAVVFFARPDLPAEVFDSDAVVLRGGRIAGAPIPLSRMAETARDGNALSTWFPTAAPRLYRRPDGRVWLDVLESASPPDPHRSPTYVIYHRVD
ncbi:MAG TPA: hypothetical protein VML54_09045, partial [Candidatus Limnocylindrales bacterium]|nr:hypothetical protein [Candidatus Limnocylindrales bacterium]